MPRRYVDRESALRSVRKGLERGSAEALGPKRPSHALHGTPVPYSWKLRYAGNCSAPVHIFRDGVRTTNRPNLHEFGRSPRERPVMTEIEVPCRQCENCMRRRAAHWRFRAMAETRLATRTWFGTLTLSPDQHARVAAACRVHAAKDGDDFDTLDADEQFRRRHECISREITLYVKRLRKQSGANIRILCVAEVHKSGLPHYHMLIHEGDLRPIRHATLQGSWRVGFSNWKLVTDVLAVGYVTKYLAKSMMARVRASTHYGQGNTSSDIVPLQKERVKNETSTNPPVYGGRYGPEGSLA